MLLTEYLDDFAKAIDEFSKTDLIVASELKVDARTEKLGLIKAVVVFIDDSKLFITEYVDLRYKLEKLTYSFHYQDKEGNLVFRYDNAPHKPALSFQNHKHSKETIFQSEIPELKEVLEEIVSDFLRNK
jgi:hypothetical protein